MSKPWNVFDHNGMRAIHMGTVIASDYDAALAQAQENWPGQVAAVEPAAQAVTQ